MVSLLSYKALTCMVEYEKNELWKEKIINT